MDRDFLRFSRLRRAACLLLGLGACLFVLSTCGKDYRISGQAPGFQLKQYGGETFEMRDYSQQVTLVVFWATWCQPCLMEIPSLMKVHEKFRDRRFQVVGINVDDPEGSKVAAIRGNFGINYPLLIGNEDVMKEFGGVTALPTSFLVGKDGRIKAKLQGLMEEARLEETILTALNESI